jgi:ABC-type multidrug transport system fused ATPase/permease subunit
MNTATQLLKKENISQLSLIILMMIYLIMGFKTPEFIAIIIDNIFAKIVIVLILVYLFMYMNPILAVVATFVAFDLMRRSDQATGLGALSSFAPSEKKKMSQFTAFNQFPYTLEQEVVAKMAPLIRSGNDISKASYKPTLENLYNASPLTAL